MHWWKWIWNEDFFSLSVLLVLLHWRLYLRYPREILSIIVTRRSTSVAHITMTCIFITLFYFPILSCLLLSAPSTALPPLSPAYNNCLRWLIHILPRHLLSLQTYLPSCSIFSASYCRQYKISCDYKHNYNQRQPVDWNKWYKIINSNSILMK